MSYPQYSKIIYCLCHLHYKNDTQCHAEVKELQEATTGHFLLLLAWAGRARIKVETAQKPRTHLKSQLKPRQKQSPSVNAGQTEPAWSEADFSFFQIK